MATETVPATNMSAITVSATTRTHSVFRYFLPVQSLHQFVHAVVLTAVVLALGGIPIYLFDPEALSFVLLCGAAGAFGAGFYPVLPGHMKLTTRGEARHFVPDIDKHMTQLGYVEFRSSPTGKRYRSRARPWMRWEEQEVEIAVGANVIDVNGPVATLRWLRMLLERANGRA